MDPNITKAAMEKMKESMKQPNRIIIAGMIHAAANFGDKAWSIRDTIEETDKLLAALEVKDG